MFWECQIVKMLWTEIKNTLIELSSWQLTNFELSYERKSFCDNKDNSLTKTIFFHFCSKVLHFRCKCGVETTETNHF